jgi:hypothetical protein
MLAGMKIINVLILSAVVACSSQQAAQVAQTVESGIVRVAKDVCTEESTQPNDPALVDLACIIEAVGDVAAPKTEASIPPKRAHVRTSRAAWEAMP